MFRPTPVVLALTLATLALPACAPKNSATAGARTITIWEQMDPAERDRFEQNLAAFKASHPGIEIRHTPYDTEELRSQFQTAAAAGGGPQLVFGPSDQVGPLSLLKLIRPLDETLPAGFFDRFIPAALDTLNGHLWAAPDQVGNHLVLCYNKKLVPQPPATAAEFMKVAKALTKKGADGGMQYGFAMNTTEPYWLVPFLTGYGGWVMDASHTPTLDTPAMQQALAFLKSLQTQGVMPKESDYNVADNLFKDGKAAMIINGPWSWAGYRKAGVDLGIAPIFRLPSGQWARPMVASKGYSISVNVKPGELPTVITLLDFLTSPEAEKRGLPELGVLPSQKPLWEDPAVRSDPLLGASQQALELGRRMPVVPEMRVIWDAMRPGMQGVMNGTAQPAAAARDMQRTAATQIAQQHQ